jgi:hypothetical protein
MISVTMSENSELKHKQHNCLLEWNHEYNANYVYENATDSKMGQMLPYGHVILESLEVTDVTLLEITRPLYFQTSVFRTPNQSTTCVPK